MFKDKETQLTRKPKKFQLSPVAIIALSFLVLILVGAILLYCPFSRFESSDINFFDCLFLSTSFCTVSGIVPLKDGLAANFNLVGRIIQTILIQIGGLGAATFAGIFFIIASRKLTFKQQSLIKESWNLKSLSGIKKIFFLVFLESIVIETIGTFLCFFYFYFIQNFDIATAWGYSIYHSVSAFNNAGVDLLGTTSLINYQNDVYLNFVLSTLVVLGGTGFLVNIDIIKKKFNFKKFDFHTKMVVTYSLSLILFGTFFVFIIELFNNQSNVTFYGSYFMSIYSRTAGFSLYDLSQFSNASMIIFCILMFIGGSPGGTAGGIKTTTFGCLLAYLRSVIQNNTPHSFRRTISNEITRKALLIIILGFMFFIFGFTLICLFEGNYNYYDPLTGDKSYLYQEGYLRYNALDFCFLAMAAFSTTGFSTGITPFLSVGSKIVLMILMYVGRVGPLAISTVFSGKNTKPYRYAEGDISIG